MNFHWKKMFYSLLIVSRSPKKLNNVVAFVAENRQTTNAESHLSVVNALHQRHAEILQEHLMDASQERLSIVTVTKQ